jgi:putative ABC transport system substrate-binding protein
MDRRTFVASLGAGVLSVPRWVQAQQPGSVARVGYLQLQAPSEQDEAFWQGLREHGWIEGKNITIEARWANGNRSRLAGLADEIVRQKVDVIYVTSTATARAALNATRTIPIVFTSVADPVRAGLVTNLARPTGNITGLSTINVDLSAKRLELIKEAVPGAKRVGVLMNPDEPAVGALKETERAAAALGLELRVLQVRRPDDLDEAFARMVKDGVTAALGLPDPMYNSRSTQMRMAALAAKSRLPTMVAYRGAAEAGVLMSYGPDLTDLYRRGATYVDKILKGAKPADLPVEQPTKVELVINLKAAKALGLTLPQSLLLRADEVIQ